MYVYRLVSDGSTSYIAQAQALAQRVPNEHLHFMETQDVESMLV